MKSFSSIVFFALFLSFIGVQAQTKPIDLGKSSIQWVGKKMVGQHVGTLQFSSGDMVFEKEKLVGGNFVVDMTTISATDLEGKSKEGLDGHLKSDDFFGVEKFPTANLVMKEIKDSGKGVYNVVADLTIKGITKEIQFPMHLHGNHAHVDLKVDRTEFGIQYASKNFFKNIGDKFIEDIFELTVHLSF
jgi:polyisoprenoid-binding protein YceI